MPVAYQIDSAQGAVFSTARGQVTFDEVLHFHAALLNDPGYRSEFCELADMRLMTDSTITGAEMRQLAATELFSADSKRAFVAASPLVYGLSRMYESHRVSKNDTGIRIFSNVEEAIEWLGVSLPAPVDRPSVRTKSSGNAP
jgi:hypothetical protein